MGPRAVLDGRKISSPPVSIPDLPARSQSLYRLRYPTHDLITYRHQYEKQYFFLYFFLSTSKTALHMYLPIVGVQGFCCS